MASIDASPFCVGTHASMVPSFFTHAVQVCGSMVAWFKKGAEYSAVTTFAAPLKPASTSPRFKASSAFASSRPCASCFAMVSEETDVSPSHVMPSDCSAMSARHQLSASTATKSFASTTCFTPRRFSAAAFDAASTDLSVPPKWGHCAMDACSRPFTVTSVANTGLPSTLSGMSRRCGDVPAMVHAFASLSVTAPGTGCFAAAVATSP